MSTDKEFRQMCLDFTKGEASEREAAYFGLLSMGEHAYQLICQILVDGDVETKLAATIVFDFLYNKEKIRQSEASTLFLDLFEKETHPELRETYIYALVGLLRTDSNIKIELHLLPYLFDEGINTRFNICSLMASVKQIAAIPHLSHLLSDNEKLVSQAAKEALKEIGTADALFALWEWEKRNSA